MVTKEIRENLEKGATKPKPNQPRPQGPPPGQKPQPKGNDQK